MRVDEVISRVLLDTNVLIYATLAADPRNARAQEVLAMRSGPHADGQNARLLIFVLEEWRNLPCWLGGEQSGPQTL
jgi:hypothetical protein